MQACQTLILTKKVEPFASIVLNLVTYRPVRKEYDLSKLKIFISKKFSKLFYFLTCILPDNVFHESLKNFWQNSHYENMRVGFLKGVKIYFGKSALK